MNISKERPILGRFLQFDMMVYTINKGIVFCFF